MTTNVVLFYSWWTIRWQGGVIQVPTTQVLLRHNKTQQVLVFILVLIFQFHSATVVVPFAGNVSHVSFEEEGWCADVRLAQVPSRRTPFCWLDVSFSSSCHTVLLLVKKNIAVSAINTPDSEINTRNRWFWCVEIGNPCVERRYILRHSKYLLCARHAVSR